MQNHLICNSLQFIIANARIENPNAKLNLQFSNTLITFAPSNFYTSPLLFSNTNSMDLVSRLKFFMENANIGISQFADTCRIPRPTMSQILNGRNKKISDELISKIHAAYPQLSVLWLMFGEGDMEIGGNIKISDGENASKNSSTDRQMPINETVHESAEGLQSQQSLFTENFGSPFESANGGQQTNPSLHTNANTQEQASRPSDRYISDQTDLNNGIPATHYEGNNSFIDFESEKKEYLDQPSGATLDSANNPFQSKKPATPNSQMPHAAADGQTPQAHLPADNVNIPAGTISLQPSPGKQITNIVVFYSDNSFQSFYPTPPYSAS